MISRTPYDRSPGAQWLYSIMFAAFCALLAYGLFRPEPVPVPFKEADKLAHFGVFFMFGLSLRLLLRNNWHWGLWLIAVALAAIAEPAQAYWRPLRVFSYGDMLANIGGACCAMFMVQVLANASKSKKSAA